MRLKDRIEELKNPTFEMINMGELIMADKVTVCTVDGNSYTFTEKELVAVNDEVIVYERVHEIKQVTQYVHIAVDKIVNIIYKFDNEGKKK